MELEPVDPSEVLDGMEEAEGSSSLRSFAQLTPRQAKVLEGLAEGLPVSRAVEKASVSRRSFYYWTAHCPSFRMALRQAEELRMRLLEDRLATVAERAVAELESILSDPKSRPLDRLRIFMAVTDRLLSLRQVLALEERISTLELRLQVGERWNGGFR